MKIRNNKTGQVIDVPEEELYKYGLGPAPQQNVTQMAQQLSQQNSNQPSKEQIIQGLIPYIGDPSTSGGRVIDSAIKVMDLLYPEMKVEEEKKEEGTGVLALIDTLKSLYNQPNMKGETPVKGKKDLSYGKENWPSFLTSWGVNAKIMLNQAPDEKTYKRLKEGFTASLKEATGDTGVMTDKDYERIANALPDFGDTDESAMKAWESIDKILLGKYGRVGNFNYIPNMMQQPQPAVSQAQQMLQPAPQYQQPTGTNRFKVVGIR